MPDQMVFRDDWSDLRRYREMPEIDFDRLHAYRLNRIKSQLRRADVSMCVLLSPISLRYAVDYRDYALFQSHIPSVYLFVPVVGPVVVHGSLRPTPLADVWRSASRYWLQNLGWRLAKIDFAAARPAVGRWLGALAFACLPRNCCRPFLVTA